MDEKKQDSVEAEMMDDSMFTDEEFVTAEEDVNKDETMEETSEELIEESVEEILEEDKVEEASEEVNQGASSNNEESALKLTIARLQADFLNYKNRTEKEKSSVHAYAAERLMKKLLPVIDNLERAIATEKEHDAFFEGVQMIYNELIKVLEGEGLERYESVGEKFDPNFHQAIFMEDSETVESEHIIETFQAGYKLKDKVIRPAMVKVSK